MSGGTGRESYASKANQRRFGETNGAVLNRILFEQRAISLSMVFPELAVRPHICYILRIFILPKMLGFDVHIFIWFDDFYRKSSAA